MSSLVYGIHAVESLVDSNQAKEIFVLKKQNKNPKIDAIVDSATTKGLEVNLVSTFKELPFRVKKDANHQNIFAIEKTR